MPDNNFTKALTLNIRNSAQKWMIVIIPHFMSLLLLSMMNSLPILLRISLSALVLISFYYYLRLYTFKSSKKSVLSIQQDSSNNWVIVTTGDQQHSVKLMPSSFFSNILIVLNYMDINKKHYSVIITQDSLSKDEFRQLKVRLKTS
jgi:hypothetical protein